MDLRILGPLEVHDDRRVTVPRRRMVRLLLGTLALRSNLAVSRDDLTDALWDGRPPASAAANLRSYAADLRHLLGPRTGTGPSVEAAAGGYRLRVGAGDLDALRFEALAADGRRLLAAGDCGTAGDRLARALATWRGPVLGDLALPDLVTDDARALDDRRLAATEDSVAARLELGAHAALVGELEALIGRHPTRERLWCQLMLALYRDGRQADALAAYRRLYRLLADELGVEPGPDSQDMHRRILGADPGLRLRETARVRPVPWPLPPVPGSFTGRDGYRDELDALARPVPRGPLSIAVLTGTAGVGKTALALHWAHLRRDRFPDGCLYADLRGYGPDRPRAAEDVLAEFLRALDVRADEPSPGRYRTELNGRRMLVVLDNACAVEQVRPLLPGDSCTVLVTSRDTLNGLVVRDGARRVDVGRLGAGESADLLRRLIGARADADPGAVDALVRRCARLPLALRIAADLVTLRPAMPLADLVGEFGAEHGRLDVLDAGGEDTAIRTVLSWSMGHLDDRVRRAFRLLGLHPGQHVDAHAVAALAGAPAGPLLAGLLRAHLVEEVSPGRWAAHDLLRAYARELADAAGADATGAGADERRAALDRLGDQQLAAAARAMDLVYPQESARRPRVDVDVDGPVFGGAPDARRWLDAETANLLALADIDAERIGRFSGTLQRHLHTGGRYAEALGLSERAADAARRRADRPGEAWALGDVALNLFRLGRHAEAAERFADARARHAALGDRLGESVCLRGLGMVAYRQGRPGESLPALTRSLELCRELGDRAGEGAVLCNIGLVHEWTGGWAPALDCYRRALAIHRDLGFAIGEGDVLNNLGIVYRQTGDLDRAAEALSAALDVYRAAGDRGGEGAVLNNLGLIGVQRADWAAARGHLSAALAVHLDIGHREAELETLNIFGELAYRSGAHADALHRFRGALALAVELEEPGAEMNAQRGLGEALHACGQPAAASRHYRAALAIARSSGARPDEADALAGLARCLDSEPYRRRAAAIYRELGVDPEVDPQRV